MDYPRYRGDGWPIGSGAVEGTCKHLVKERDNVTGARWRRDNIPFVLALRLSIFNEKWESDRREKQPDLPTISGDAPHSAGVFNIIEDI